MAIPNSREAPPPPLPPPRRLALEQGEDLGWKYGNRSPTSPHASIKPGSSLLLGSGTPNRDYSGAWSPPYDYHHNHHHHHHNSHDNSSSRRGSTVSTVTPIDPAMIMDGLDQHSDEDRSMGKRPTLSRYVT